MQSFLVLTGNLFWGELILSESFKGKKRERENDENGNSRFFTFHEKFSFRVLLGNMMEGAPIDPLRMESERAASR